MQLIYRGNIFDYNSSNSNSSGMNGFKANQAAARRTSTQPVTLIYRGATYSIAPDAQPLDDTEVQTPHTLIYRGSTYVVNGSH